MKNYRKRYQNKAFIISSSIIVCCVIFLTIGFSAFSSNLGIYGISAVFHLHRDIRVTNLSLVSANNGAVTNYERFDEKSITSSVSMPNDNSEVTYKIELTNVGNVEMGLLNITGLPSNLKYVIDESSYKIGEPICDDIDSTQCKLGAVKNIYLKIIYDDNSYNPSDINYEFNLIFDFKKIYTITYNGFDNVSSLPAYIMDGENKSITFDNDTYIPLDVSIFGAVGDYVSPTLTITNATKNVTVYRKYLINYELNGGTQVENQVNLIAYNESINLLDPVKEDYKFYGWFDNPDFEGERILQLTEIDSDITLYANWKQYDYYCKEKTFDGSTNNVIDTGIMLYSAENVNKNFRISFTIDSYDSSYDTTTNINNNQPPTIVSSMNEKGSPWPGFVYRLVTNGGATKYSMKINDSHVTSFLKYYPLGNKYDVEIVREDGVIYTKINSNRYTKVLDYGGVIDTFDVPLTIGANINDKGKYSRTFKGKLSNIIVEFYTGSIIEEENTYNEVKNEDSYELNGTITFDGTNYVDTGINLFSAENINKDFEISLILEEVDTNESQATLINLKDESQIDVWPGVAYRTSGSSSTLEFAARWPGQANVRLYDNAAAPKKIIMTRKNGKIYYSINYSDEVLLIETAPESLTKEFKSNLTFGASTDDNGNPFRFFKGVVSNIRVNLYDNEEDNNG